MSEGMASPVQTAYERSGGGEGTIEELVLSHVPLVRFLAGQACVDLPRTVCEEDVIGAGTLGLVEAAHRYDPSFGVRFSTFAYPRIRGAIIDHLRQCDPLGKSAREQLNGLRRHIAECRARDGRTPSIKELGRASGLSEDDVVKYLSYEKWDRVVSLMDVGPASGEEAGEPGGPLAAEAETPLAKLEWQERVERLSDAIRRLPERQQQIIVMYYYEGLYMAEMAEVLGVSEGRVSQLHTRALYDLTRMLEGE